MATTTTVVVSHQPTYNIISPFLSLHLNFSKPIRSARIRNSKSTFPRGILSKEGLLNKVLGKKAMTELVKVSIFASKNGDEDVGLFQQEDVVNGSSQFRANGFESAINRLSKWLFACSFGAVVVLRHDGEALWACTGVILNYLLSIKLKKIFNQDRPVYGVRSDPGMPSSHAQSIFFILSFVVLSIVEWHGVNKFSLTIGGVALALAIYFTSLWVTQKLHTISQVLVGAVLGSILSTLWFWSWSAVVMRAFDSLLWVQISVVLGSAVSLMFVIYVFRNWLKDEP